MTGSLREAALAALAAQLAAALPGVPVETDRRAPLGPEESLPRIVLRDDGQDGLSGFGAGTAAWRLAVEVEGYAAGGGALGAARRNGLHAAVVAALVGPKIAVGGAVMIAPEETRLEVEMPEDADPPLAIFAMALRFDLSWPDDAGAYAD